MQSNSTAPAPRPAHHRPGGGFRNPWPGSAPTGLGGLFRWFVERARRAPATRPVSAPPRVVPSAHATPRAGSGELRITAIGHSTFLIQLDSLNILTDPVWGERASPLAFAGPKRRHAPGLALEALPPIGVAARLRARGVHTVIECDWWAVAPLGAARAGARVTCLPAAHFSGRTPFDRDTTLWCGWAIEVAERRVYFVGDTGMHPEFEAIGRQLGALDAVRMPIGAYEPRWFMRPVHLDPDETLAAFGALTAPHAAHPTVMIAMHWGTFDLTDEPPDEPPRRIAEGWHRERRPSDRLWVLAPGETRTISSAR